jgi:fructokinase
MEAVISSETSQVKQRPVIVGEVLYDQFPDGRQVLGGAPFNVAWNLRGLGFSPVFVSAVGNDAEGRYVKETMDSWGLTSSVVQTHEDRATGRVRVRFEDGQPHYEIIPDQAYDYINFDVVQEQLPVGQEDLGLLYHGSLAWRREVTRDTILQLRQQTADRIFVDLNIRDPWFEPAWVPQILSGIHWLKLNVDELSRLTNRNLDDFSAQSEIASAVSMLRQQFDFQTCFVTAGPRGAFAVNPDDFVLGATAPPISHIVDTVGAGDAFSAMTIAGILANEPLELILQRAVSYAARICMIRGATTMEASVYSSMSEF